MVSGDALAELRQRAARARESLGARQPPRPLFVEFSGPPKSGKSTCIDIVAHFFRRMDFRILTPTEPGTAKRTPYYLQKMDPMAFYTWSASYVLTHVLEGLYHSDRYHLAIFDRGLFDALAWFELLATGDMSGPDDRISPDIRDRIQSFLLIDKWRSVIDLLFLFRADPKTSLERESRDKLVQEPGRRMPQFLEQLNAAYDQVFDRYSRFFPPHEIIDTSDTKGTTAQGNAWLVVDRILKRAVAPGGRD